MASKMAMHGEITNQQENGMRLQLLLEKMIKFLRGHLHPTFTIDDPYTLYEELNKLRPELEKLRKKNWISKDQMELLLPTCGCKSYSEKFDSSLIMQLLYTFCGYNRSASKQDILTKTEENFKVMKKNRDIIQHGVLSISDKEFEDIFHTVKPNLMDLGCCEDEVNSVKTIKLIDSKCKEKIKKLEDSSTGPFNYKYLPPVPNFVGREEDLKDIHEKLLELNSSVNFSNPVYGLVISGMSGVGKSEFVRKYWLTYGQLYYENTIIWINAENQQVMANAFLEVAEQAGLSVKDQDGRYEATGKIISKVYRHFTIRRASEPARKVLFVFDNLNNSGEIQHVLPDTIHYAPYILITSQSKMWDSRFQVIDLPVLPKEIAEMFFENNLESSEKENKQAIHNLLVEVERHPLAMQQSTAYINTNGITINKYIDLLKQKGKELLKDDTLNNFNCEPVYNAISLSLNNLTKMDNINTAVTLLSIMSFLDGKNIKKGFLLQFCDDDELLLNRSLTVLKNLSLINIPDSNKNVEYEEHIVMIHALIQKVLKYENNLISDKDLLDRIFEKIFGDIESSINSNKTLGLGRYWFNHLLYLHQSDDTRNDLIYKCINNLDKLLALFKAKGNYNTFLSILKSIEEMLIEMKVPATSNVFLSTKCCIAKTLLHNGEYKEALTVFKQVEEKQIKVLRKEHPDLLTTQNNIASTLQEIGDHKEALKIFQKVEEKQINVFGEEHPELYKTQHNIASILQQIGDHKGALKIMKHVEEMQVKVFGEEHPAIFTTQHNIASIVKCIGDHKGALKIYKQVEVRQIKVFGEEHPDLLTTQHNIASTLQLIGDHKGALKIFKQVEITRLKILGEDHPALLATQHDIASILQEIGDHKGALKIFKQVEEKQVKVLGEEHPELIKTQHNIASLLQQIGDHKGALKIFKQVEEKQIKVLGEEHIDLLTTQHNIASTLQQIGDHKGALEIFKQVEEKQVKVLGEEHPELMTTQHNIAAILKQIGDHKGALKIFKQVEEKQIKVLGEENPELLKTQHSIASTLQLIGDHKGALKIFKQVEEKQIKVLGKEHPDLLTTQHSIASILQLIGDLKGALKIFKQVEKTRLKILGGENPALFTTQHNIALILQQIGDHKGALKILKTVKEKQIKVLGGKHLDLLKTQHSTASTLHQIGDYKGALKIFKEVEETQINVLGEEHPDLLMTQHNIASTLQLIGEHKEALKIFKQVEEKQIKLFGEEHPGLLATQHNIASTFKQIGDHKEALKIFKQVEEKQIKHLGETHPALLTTQHNIASTVKQIGDHKGALKIYKQVEEKQIKIFGEEHPELLTTQHNIATTLLLIGDHKGALKIFKQVEISRLKILGEDHPALLATQHNIASLLQEIGDHKGALKILKQVEEKQIKIFGEEHPALLTTQHNIVSTLQRIGDHKGALTISKGVEEKYMNPFWAQQNTPSTLKDVRENKDAPKIHKQEEKSQLQANFNSSKQLHIFNDGVTDRFKVGVTDHFKDGSTELFNDDGNDHFSWWQTMSDLDLEISVPKSIKKAKELSIEIRTDHLKVCLKNDPSSDSRWTSKVLLEGTLEHKIRCDESMWSLLPDNHQITMNLEKIEHKLWTRVFEENTRHTEESLGC